MRFLQKQRGWEVSPGWSLIEESVCHEELVEKYSGLHSKCEEGKEQRPGELRNRASSHAVAVSVGVRHVLCKGLSI